MLICGKDKNKKIKNKYFCIFYVGVTFSLLGQVFLTSA